MRRPGFRPQHDDPARVVTGLGGTLYDCSDLRTLDGHLEVLRQQIARTRFRERIVEFRADIDLLLDRRLWLSLTSTCADRTTPAH